MTSTMGDFTYPEKADMHHMYGCANCKGRAALQMYHTQFPYRRMPYHRIFSDLRTYLNVIFDTRWIGRGGPVPWPPRSLNLSIVDYSLWEYLKNLAHATALDTDENIVARISELLLECMK
ncbi:uncharacterized protein TNCV_4306661 [Trichonephila clavipes]|nr:uncharacterized protein TNCV_4306661 [Trichonephila clavipes]